MVYKINFGKLLFLLAGHKVDFIDPSGSKNPFSALLVEKKTYSTREKHSFSLVAQYTIPTVI